MNSTLDMIPELLIIDDDPVNNLICRLSARVVDKELRILDFTSPREGLSFIEVAGKELPPSGHVLVFLDINMPEMNGWELLERFSLLDESSRQKFEIFIVSSSVNATDHELASESRHVKGFLKKPVTAEILRQFFPQRS